MNLQYREYKFYSPEWDGQFVRISTTNPDHVGRTNPGEYFMLLPWNHGRKWREQRLKALEAIAEAVQAGYDPGEVFIGEQGRVEMRQEELA